MKHSELRHQPRHVNPRIQDTCCGIPYVIGRYSHYDPSDISYTISEIYSYSNTHSPSIDLIISKQPFLLLYNKRHSIQNKM